MSFVNGKFVPMPINRTTVNQILGKNYTTDAEVQEYFDRAKVETKTIENSEDVVISKVGRDCIICYTRYTTKHWGIDRFATGSFCFAPDFRCERTPRIDILMIVFR